jgi:hypothetical protein
MLKALNKQLERWYFPVVFKYVALAVFILLVAYGFLGRTTDSSLIVQLRNTNFGNLIVWSCGQGNAESKR